MSDVIDPKPRPKAETEMTRLTLVILHAVAIFIFFGSQPAKSADLSVVCSEKGGLIEVSFSDGRIPANFVVLRPDGGMVYVASPGSKTDFRKRGVRSGTLVVDPIGQIGEQFTEDGSKQPRVVFDDAGTYTLLFSRSNEVQQSTEDSSCKINVDDMGKASLVSVSIDRTLDQCETATTLAPVNCRSSSSCQSGGHGYCCSRSSSDPNSPCYCNNCCVAAMTQFVE